MDNINLENLSINIEVPIIHEIPKSTLESLIQIRNEFSQKLEEANLRNDISKKKRYQRQMKHYEDAIKATKEGKSFNYSELIVPPGFSQIPIKNDGTALLNSDNQLIKNESKFTEFNHNKSPKQKSDTILENNVMGEEILERLYKEIEESDIDEEDIRDPEDEFLIKQINSLMPKIDEVLPKDNFLSRDNIQEKIKSVNIFPENNLENYKNFPSFSKLNSTIEKSKQKQQQFKRIENSNKDLKILLERQTLFKEAALNAKKEGNLNVALVYLRNAKGFDSMILAAQNGLPLDMNNLPIPPQIEKKLENLKTDEASSLLLSKKITYMTNNETTNQDRNSIYIKLIHDLKEQLNIATHNLKHFTNMGDVNNANKFNLVAKETIQDLEAVKNAYSQGEPMPLYHYEKRSYQTIDCNSDLTDNELELVIIRAINLPLPKDFEAKNLTTYVKFEFPYPTEALQTDRTGKQIGTLNPEYNQTFKLQIQRKQNKFVRLMSRKELKLEIFYKAGLLKGDKLLASCFVKLQPLEKNSTIHDAFDLLDGRRQIGGKLEVKIKIREPLLHKEVKCLEQKWLIIDKFNIQNK